MRLFLIALLLMPLLTHSQALETYRWKNRILLLCEKREDLSRSRSQIAMFREVTKEVEERQLLLLVYDGKHLRDRNNKVLTNTKMQLIKSDFEGVLLIGKDGGIKYESDFYVTPEIIFEIIDSMPMRKAEMRRKND